MKRVFHRYICLEIEIKCRNWTLNGANKTKTLTHTHVHCLFNAVNAAGFQNLGLFYIQTYFKWFRKKA